VDDLLAAYLTIAAVAAAGQNHLSAKEVGVNWVNMLNICK
jgi:hypothetical protein